MPYKILFDKDLNLFYLLCEFLEENTVGGNNDDFSNTCIVDENN
jgi:hypothetical protein